MSLETWRLAFLHERNSKKKEEQHLIFVNKQNLREIKTYISNFKILPHQQIQGSRGLATNWRYRRGTMFEQS